MKTHREWRSAIDRAFHQETKGKGYADGSSGKHRASFVYAMVTFV
jgi:hypothetical protein